MLCSVKLTIHNYVASNTFLNYGIYVRPNEVTPLIAIPSCVSDDGQNRFRPK